MERLRITKQFISRTIAVVIASVVANAVFLAIIRPMFNAPATFSPFFYGSVIELTAAGVVAAAAVYVVMGLMFPRRDRNRDFVIVAIVALVLSFIPDLTLPFSHARDNQGATWPIVIALMILHVIPALVVIFGFTRGIQDVKDIEGIKNEVK
jgi:O-antigen/teichoic acid export membrane protein